MSYRPTDRWELALDLQYVGWNAYDSLNVYFNEAELGIAPIKAEKDYKNSMTYRIGASYKTTDRLVLRAGYIMTKARFVEVVQPGNSGNGQIRAFCRIDF